MTKTNRIKDVLHKIRAETNKAKPGESPHVTVEGIGYISLNTGYVKGKARQTVHGSHKEDVLISNVTVTSFKHNAIAFFYSRTNPTKAWNKAIKTLLSFEATDNLATLPKWFPFYEVKDWNVGLDF